MLLEALRLLSLSAAELSISANILSSERLSGGASFLRAGANGFSLQLSGYTWHAQLMHGAHFGKKDANTLHETES